MTQAHSKLYFEVKHDIKGQLGRLTACVTRSTFYLPITWHSYIEKCLYIQHSEFNSTYRSAFYNHHHHHLSLNREGRWGTKDNFTTSFFNFPLFSTAIWDLPNSRPVHSLMLSPRLFLCLPCLLPTFTVPCKVVLARPDERETCLDTISVWVS